MLDILINLFITALILFQYLKNFHTFPFPFSLFFVRMFFLYFSELSCGIGIDGFNATTQTTDDSESSLEKSKISISFLPLACTIRQSKFELPIW